MKKIIVSTSGGKDSTAVYLLALEAGVEFLPVFADTGNEHPLTYEFVATLHEKTGGPKVQWVTADFSRRMSIRRKNLENGVRCKGWDDDRRVEAAANLSLSGIPFLDMCLYKGRFPSTTRRFCSLELKHLPILEQVCEPLMDEGHEIESWQGVRALESKERSCLPVRETDQSFEEITIYRPVIGWTAKEIFDLHRRHGLSPNPLYKMGCKRVGCMPCIHVGKLEIRNIARRFPDHVDKIERWEAMVARTSKIGVSTFFPADKTPGSGDTRSSIRRVVQWSNTHWGGKQYMIPEPIPACSSQYGLCE